MKFNDEEYDRSVRRLAIVAMIAIIVFAVGVEVVRAELAYGDWTCAFSNCVKVKR